MEPYHARRAVKSGHAASLSNMYGLLQPFASFSVLWHITTTFDSTRNGLCGKSVCFYFAVCAAILLKFVQTETATPRRKNKLIPLSFCNNTRCATPLQHPLIE